MFELWKDDQSRVRLDENSQVSSFLGSYWVDRTNWSQVDAPPYPSFTGRVSIHPDTIFVMMGTTDGQVVAINSMSTEGSTRWLNLSATGRAGMWFYCFGAKNNVNSNSGLQFLDINGNVTFDSQAKWLRLSGRIRSPVYNTDYPWPSGVPTIAVGMSQQGIWLVPNLLGGRRAFLIMSYGLRISTGLVAQVAMPRQGPFAEIVETPRPPPGDLFFADVTRY